MYPYASLSFEMAPLRQRGLRRPWTMQPRAFDSMRHVLHVRPDIIKLDRTLIAGIDDDEGQVALSAALVEFARRISATPVAEGIETQEGATADAGIGIAAGLG